MKDPKNTGASSPDSQAPGNGNAWNTVHNADGAPEKGASVSNEEVVDNVEGSEDGADDSAVDAEELEDAVLEAEAAAIIDEAEEELREKAKAQVAEDGVEASEVVAEADADAARKQAAEWQDKYMRLHAEWDTYRRRQKEQAAQQKALAAEKLVGSLIPVIDDLERSIDYAKNNGETGLLSGVEAVLNKFVDTLCKDGVEVIDPEGEAFNALEAQAVGTVDDPSQPDETVAEVYQKGYKIGNKVLRPAMVTVTTGGPARPKEKENEDE